LTTERVQVTRQLVLAATQTSGETFTVNDVMALMTGRRKIDGQARLRVRASIAHALVRLCEGGELIRDVEGYVRPSAGKPCWAWRRAPMTGPRVPVQLEMEKAFSQ
jgi:hypothetical protein